MLSNAITELLDNPAMAKKLVLAAKNKAEHINTLSSIRLFEETLIDLYEKHK